MWMDNWVLNLPLNCWPTQTNSAELTHRTLFRFFESQSEVVVLSNSNKAEREAFPEACLKRGIPILKRKGGGGTVVLGPGCLILTFAFFAKDLFANHLYFELINGLWIDALAQAGVGQVTQKGISDLAIGDKKIAGTSIFRKKHLVVYQGSLLVDVDLDKISELLGHPSREPDYRQGRDHKDFLTSLRLQGHTHSASELAETCTTYFQENAVKRLQSHFVAPQTLLQGGKDFWASLPVASQKQD